MERQRAHKVPPKRSFWPMLFVVMLLVIVVLVILLVTDLLGASNHLDANLADHEAQAYDMLTHEQRIEELMAEISSLREEREILQTEVSHLQSQKINLALERERLQLLAMEAQYFENQYVAGQALASSWLIMPSTVSQGDIVLVRHHDQQTVTFGEQHYELQPFGAGYYAYLPVPANMPPGEYDIGDRTLTVKAKQFPTQYLEVSDQLADMRRDTERIAADQVKVREAMAESETQFLFSPESLFVKPIEGRLTTSYGHTRYVNGNLSGRHMAIDLAMPQGTPIKATNSGVVVLAEELYLAGNSIYIDHGMGLFSQYSHLYEMDVAVGDRVEQGDIIGTVGSTGFSTGPHLHFTFWVDGVPANPDLFFNSSPFHWLDQ